MSKNGFIIKHYTIQIQVPITLSGYGTGFHAFHYKVQWRCHIKLLFFVSPAKVEHRSNYFLNIQNSMCMLLCVYDSVQRCATQLFLALVRYLSKHHKYSKRSQFQSGCDVHKTLNKAIPENPSIQEMACTWYLNYIATVSQKNTAVYWDFLFNKIHELPHELCYCQ
jgi:hypothetical protein